MSRRHSVLAGLALVTFGPHLAAEGPVASEPIPPEGSIPMRTSAPIELEIDEAEPEPALSPEPAPAATNPMPEPEPQASTPAVDPKPSPVPPANPSGLPRGQYLQLAFFESEASVARFKRQLADRPWASEVRYWFDDTRAGYRVLLGPLTAAELARQRQRLGADGYPTFRYRTGS